MTALRNAALAYAARGWPVFPCAPGGKAPAIAKTAGGNGVLDATTDAAQIRAWWVERPDANIGIATGAPGPDVADFDTDDDTGLTALAALTQAGLLDDRGMMVRTRSGGWHFYFTGTSQRSSTLRSKTGPSVCVDFKAAGGYVIAPPSFVEADERGPAGRYELISPGATQPAAIDWDIVRHVVLPPPAFRQPHREPAGRQDDIGEMRAGDDYNQRADWADILEGWTLTATLRDGTRYWRRPGKKNGMSATTGRPPHDNLYVFTTSTEFDTDEPITKFRAYAVLHHGGDYTTARQALQLAGYGPPPPAAVSTLTQPLQAADGDADGWWAEIAARYTPVDWQQLFDDTPDDEDWICYPILAAGRSISIYSPPKAGKSLLALEIAAALTAGRGVLGQPAAEPRRVLYVDLENSRRDLRDRLIDFGYQAADLARLVYLSFPSLPMLDSAQGGREITALALAHKADVVIIDTISRVIGGKENDADTFAALYRFALAPLKSIGIAVIRLDHAGKDAGRGQRGSSAKNADVDAVWTLSAAGPVITLRCEMSRTPIDVQAITMRRETSPLRHELSSPADVADPVQAMMAKLDELKVPRDHGFTRCKNTLNLHSVPVGDTNVLKRAVATRKTQLQTGLPDRSDQSGSNQTGFNETAGQTGLNRNQTGSDRSVSGESSRPVWTGSHTRGGSSQTGIGAAATLDGITDVRCCTGCGEDHPPDHPCFTRPGREP